MSYAVVVGFMLLATLGLPIAFAMGVSAVVALWISGVDFSMLPQRMMHAVNSFPLMSIPFFMLAGELMIKAGIVERLIALANSMVGRVRGGLAHVTMLAGAGLATVSGTAVSDASALSTILVPSLTKVYDKGFAAAIVAAAANLGPIIPPSGAMIVYAFMAGSSVSVGGMFMAGVVPGIIITVGFIALCSWIATRRGWAVTGEPFRLAAVLAELRRSLIVLAMPVIVIGGIVGGAFTATEGSAIAAPAAGTSIERKPGGLGGNTTDSNENSVDWFAQVVPNPQSLAAPEREDREQSRHHQGTPPDKTAQSRAPSSHPYPRAVEMSQ